MSYATEKIKSGRVPFTVVELDMDYCPLIYGTAPCNAVLGATGSQRCFNTRSTCQASPTLPSGTSPLTYRFVQPLKDLPLGVKWFPFLDGVSIQPASLDIGKGLGKRASVTITLHDAPGNDSLDDKYLSTRAYTPSQQGTFWGKFLARNPYYLGRPLRVLSGYLTYDLSGLPVYDTSNFQTRLYFIDSIDGPDAAGTVTITAKDVLKFADNNKAQCPIASQGVIHDVAGINTSVTSFTIDPPGIGDTLLANGQLAYPTSGVIRIDRELMTYTRSGNTMTIVRGQGNTVAAAHAAGASVQWCYVVGTVGAFISPIGNDPSSIIFDLLTNYGNTPAAYLDKAGWDAEVLSFVTNRYSTIISSPVGTNQLIGEVCMQVPLNIWWDERTQLVELRALRPTSGPLVTDNANFIGGSMKVTERLDLRTSQAWVYFGQFDSTDILEKPSNFQILYVNVDTNSESSQEYDQPAVQRIFSRWLGLNQLTFVQALAAGITQRYGQAPFEVTFQLDAKDNSLWTGDYITVSTRLVQNPDGTPTSLAMQITNVQEVVPGSIYQYTALEQSFTASANTVRTINLPTQNNVDLRAVHDGIYQTPTAPVTVVATVPAGAMIGSTSVAANAFQVGSWPAGSSITVNFIGRVEGMGGDGASVTGTNANVPGNPGGPAFYTRFPVTINFSTGGQIWGGGGGGGGSSANPPGASYGGGGGGGSNPGGGGVGSPPGSALSGNPGTTEAGGASVSPNGGGAGGAPGNVGAVGNISGVVFPAGGAPGNAIDGVSYVTFTGPPGDIRGPQVN